MESIMQQNQWFESTEKYSSAEDLLFRNLINYGRISYSFNGSSWMLRAYSCDGGNGFIRYYHNDDGSIGQEVLGELTWVL